MTAYLAAETCKGIQRRRGWQGDDRLAGPGTLPATLGATQAAVSPTGDFYHFARSNSCSGGEDRVGIHARCSGYLGVEAVGDSGQGTKTFSDPPKRSKTYTPDPCCCHFPSLSVTTLSSWQRAR